VRVFTAITDVATPRGTGYIGSFTTLELLIAGYGVVVVDNLYNSSEESINRMHLISGRRPAFYQIDVTDETALDDVFAKHPNIDSVVHFAALKVGLRPSLPLSPGVWVCGIHTVSARRQTHVVLVLAVVCKPMLLRAYAYSLISSSGRRRILRDSY